MKLDALIVVGLMASLRVAAIFWLSGTPVALLAGFVEMTVGAVGAGTVLKLQTKLLASGSPCRSVTPALTVAVYRVLGRSNADGVKMAPAPVQLTAPATGVPPGPVTVMFCAGA